MQQSNRSNAMYVQFAVTIVNHTFQFNGISIDFTISMRVRGISMSICVVIRNEKETKHI